jgi:hypothetical protein
MTSTMIMITNPEVIKYLKCQLYTEAILVLTLLILVPTIVYEEYRHFTKRQEKRTKMEGVGST